MKNRTIFRNEPSHVCLAVGSTQSQIADVVEAAFRNGVRLFSNTTPTWELIYYNHAEEAIAGCSADWALRRAGKFVTAEEFIAEIENPKKRAKNDNTTE